MNTVRFLGWLIGMVFSTATVAQTFEADVNEYLSANSQVSSIGLTANIKSGQLVKLLKQQLKEPLASGQSPELGFLLHADESITKEKVERILVTPFREAYDEIKRVPRTIKRTVKVGREAYKCYLKPWKWKTCWKDVFKDITETVIDEVTVRIPAVAAVHKDVVVPFIEINQSLVPIKGHFSYEVGLDDLGLDFIGNRYTVTGLFNVNVRTNVYLDNLPQAITPKGNFNSRFRIKVVQSGYLEIKPNGALQVSDPASSLDFVEAFGSGFVVDAINFGSKTLPVTGYLLDLVGKEVDNQLNKAVKKQLEEYADKINVKNYASKLIKDFDRPLKLNDNGLIYPNVTGLFISQLNGKTVNAVNQVEIKFGVTFQPFATFEVQPLPIANKDSLIQFNTDVMAGDGVNLTLPAFVTYDFIAAQLKPFVDAFNKENEDKFFVKKFMIDKVAARYAKEGNVQLSVDLLRRKKGKRIGHVSINARFFATEADTTVCAKVASVQIKSSHWLIWLFKGLLKKALIKEAEKNSCKSLAKEVIAASREIDDKMVIQTPLGTVKGQTRSLSLSDILAYTNYVLLRINMVGTVQLIDR